MISLILMGLSDVFNLLFNIATIVILVSVFISWFSADPSNPLVQAVRAMTEPMYRPFRKLLRNVPGPLDFAPLIVMVLIMFLQRVIPPYLAILANRFG